MKRDFAAVAGLLMLSGCGMDRLEVHPAGTAVATTAAPAERAYQEGKADLAAGRPGLAIVAFETALANDPGSVKALNGLGAAYDGLQRYDVAQSFYRQALSRDPNNPDVINNMAISLQMAGKPGAMQWFARAERLDPRNPVIGANVNLAQAAPARTAAPTALASRDDTAVDRPQLERDNAVEYQVQLPKDRPTDLGKMIQPESPRNLAMVRPRINVPPIVDYAGTAPPIRNIVIPATTDDDGTPVPDRNTAGPARPATPAPSAGNTTSQATPLAAPVTVTAFDPSLLACAPNVAPGTLNAIIQVESGGNPLALHVNGTDQQPPPARDPAEAARTAQAYVNLGYSVDVGLMQVNSRNLAATGHSIQQALDPCTNILHGSTILSSDYARAARTRGDDPYALLAALSAYNTGDFQRGFDNGYVAQVVSSNETPRPRPHHVVEHAAPRMVQVASKAAEATVNEHVRTLKQELDRLEQKANASNATRLLASGSM